MRTLSCEESRGFLSDYLSAEIARPDAHVLEAHLSDCEGCRGEAALLHWQDRVLAELSAQARLDAIQARIHAALKDSSQLSLEAVESPPGRFPRRMGVAIAAAAAALALALLGMIFLRSPETATAVLPNPPGPAPSPNVSVPAPIAETDVLAPAPENPTPPPAPVAGPNVPDPVRAPSAPTPQAPVPPKQDPGTVTKAPEAPAPELPAGPAATVTRKPDNSVPPAIELPGPRTADQAVAAGLEFLKIRLPKLEAFRHAGDREMRVDELVLWTFVMGGVPPGDPNFERLLSGMLGRPLERTYEVALQAMILEELDRSKYQVRIAQCGQFLIDNQCRNGQWSYGDPSLFVQEVVATARPSSRPPKALTKVILQKKRDGPENGDNSNSMYAALGLRACAESGVVIPPIVIERAQKAWREAQIKGKDGQADGWCYGPKDHGHRAYGSMTAGGVGSLSIYDYLQGRDWKKNRELQSAMEWMAKNFSVAFNPGPYEHAGGEQNTPHQYYYYMYALERAGILYGTERFGAHDWYQKGSKALLENQNRDGSWASREGGSVTNDTCFAILFLRKATRALPAVQTGARR